MKRGYILAPFLLLELFTIMFHAAYENNTIGVPKLAFHTNYKINFSQKPKLRLHYTQHLFAEAAHTLQAAQTILHLHRVRKKGAT